MPPKNDKKRKAVTPDVDNTPVKKVKGTPQKVACEGAAEESPKKATATPRKAARVVPIFHKVGNPDGKVVPVDISYEGESLVSAQDPKQGGFTQTLKLQAPGSFTLVKSIMIEEGEFAGHQAVILRPAKPLPFMTLSKQIRLEVYRYYFQTSKGNSKIVIDGKRASNKNHFAKAYAGGNHNRVALLAVSKQINGEATEALYSHTIRFENTGVVVDFMSQVGVRTQKRIQGVEIKEWTKSNGRVALNLLSEATSLQRLLIESNLVNDDDPKKAARTLYNDGSRFFEMMSISRNAAKDGAEVLEYGKNALLHKVDKKPYGHDQVQSFKAELKAILSKDPALNAVLQVKAREEYWQRVRSSDEYMPAQLFVCVCGHVGAGHHCSQVMNALARFREREGIA